MSTTESTPSWVPLDTRERRILGVLVEKAKTTPEYYPLSVAALVTGSNQKSNRDPITNYDQDDIEEILQGLRRKGAVIQVEAGGRVPRWRHTLYDWLKVSKVELAVMAELLLRGPQTEGELRTRAHRMEPIEELSSLQTMLQDLATRKLIVYLSPPGQKRGVIVTHGLYPPSELEKIRQAWANRISADDEAPLPRAAAVAAAAQGPPPWAQEIAMLRTDLEAVRTAVLAAQEEIKQLKDALGV